MQAGEGGLTRRRRAATGLLLALIALVIPAVLSGATPGAVTNYVQFVGGKPGKADPKLSPVVIGWVNQQGGQAEIGPLATPAAQVAVKLTNDSLGGIHGHPLVMKTC